MMLTASIPAFALFDFGLIQTHGLRLIDGLLITFEVVTISWALGFVLGLLICAARTSKNIILEYAAHTYLTVFRGTPLLCLLYIIYYGSGELRATLSYFGVWTLFRETLFCCIFAFTLNTAAYQAEIIRGALISIPKAQIEAASALGLSTFAIYRCVVWPQAALVALRPLGNEIISLVKASALVAMVAVLDLMGQTRLIFAETFDFSIYFYAAILYLAVTELVRRALISVEGIFTRHLPHET
jgi:polar amino acid transport system permease protein